MPYCYEGESKLVKGGKNKNSERVLKEIFMIDFGEKSAPTHGSCLQPMFPPSLENHLNILVTIFTLTPSHTTPSLFFLTYHHVIIPQLAPLPLPANWCVQWQNKKN